MITDSDVYKIGTLTRTHGVHGELVFQFTDDVWDRVEADYLFCRMDGLLVPFFLEEWRFRSETTALLKFEDVDQTDTAQRLVGAEVYFPKALTPAELEEEELTWQHFMGFEVLLMSESASSAETGQRLGKVTAVFDQTANILLEVTADDGRTVLIPAHEDFVLRADHRERRLWVSVPDELLNLNV